MTSSDKIIFIAELIGTFGLVVGATGSIVYEEILGGIYGISFIAAGHFVALTIVVYAFGKYSMAHFNPAVTIAFFMTKHVSGNNFQYTLARRQLGHFWEVYLYYLSLVTMRILEPTHQTSTMTGDQSSG